MSFQFFEKLWDIQSTVEIPIDKISKHSQTVQWNGDENVDIDNCSIFLPKWNIVNNTVLFQVVRPNPTCFSGWTQFWTQNLG